MRCAGAFSLVFVIVLIRYMKVSFTVNLHWCDHDDYFTIIHAVNEIPVLT